jgi:hypothetical protein
MSLYRMPVPAAAKQYLPAHLRPFALEEADGATWRTIALALVEMDERGSWRAAGAKSTAQLAAWEYCLVPEQTEKLLRLGRKLLELAEVDFVFCDGRLTWEQVVLLTRVAVPAHEAAWLERALALPLEELERLVERSAEGWAPPVIGRRPADTQGAELAEGGGTCGRATQGRRARVTGDGSERVPLRVNRFAALNMPAARAPGHHRGAPNVRQPFHPPPSTS